MDCYIWPTGVARNKACKVVVADDGSDLLEKVIKFACDASGCFEVSAPRNSIRISVSVWSGWEYIDDGDEDSRWPRKIWNRSIEYVTRVEDNCWEAQLQEDWE